MSFSSPRVLLVKPGENKTILEQLFLWVRCWHLKFWFVNIFLRKSPRPLFQGGPLTIGCQQMEDEESGPKSPNPMCISPGVQTRTRRSEGDINL